VKVATLSSPTYSHFSLFLHLQKHLTGQKVHEDEEAKTELTTQLWAQVWEFCVIRIRKLVPRVKKCIDEGRHCVEK